MSASPGRALSSRQLLAYGALGLPLAMAALPVYVHVPRLYAEVTGMSLSLLGGLLLAARLLDAGIDPLLGGWSDRTASRRRLIVVALPCLAIGMLALLHPPALAAPLWLLASLLCTYFGFSLASVAYQAWGAELGVDAGERTRLTASREGFGLLGVVLAAALPGLLANDLARGLSALAQGFPLLLLLLASWTLFGTPPSVVRTPATGSFFADLRGVLSDGRFRRLLLVFVVNGIAAALPATLVLFFVADVLQAESWSGAFLALYFISGVAFLPLWVLLARRFGRVTSWVASMFVAVISFAWAWGLGAGDVWPFAVVCLLSGAALGADLTLPAALLAADTPLCAEQIHARVCGQGLDLSTVYRNLSTFVGMGWLQAVPGAHGERLFSLRTTSADSVTVQCLDCGRVNALPASADALCAAVADLGFRPDSVRVTLSAHCDHKCAHSAADSPTT